MFKKNDFLLIAGILLLAGLGLFLIHLPRKEAGSVSVTTDGALTAHYSLAKDSTYRLTGSGGGENLLEIRDGRARIREADCPDKLCVSQGWISKKGECVVCLPHRIVVTLTGVKDSGLDDIAE